MTTEAALAPIRARLEPALFHAPYKVADDTCGKKVVQTSNHPDLRPYVLASKMATVIANFLAEAPTDMARLIAAVQAVEALADSFDRRVSQNLRNIGSGIYDDTMTAQAEAVNSFAASAATMLRAALSEALGVEG